MNKVLDKIRKKSKPELEQEFDALDEYKEELLVRWQEFVHRARVHEMLKCLQAEHKTLQILQNNIDLDDLISDSVEQMEFDGSGQDVAGDELASTSPDQNQPPLLNQENQEQQQQQPDGRIRRRTVALEDLKNRKVMTDQEFEEILELCEDKLEQQELREAFEEKKKRDKYLHNASESRTMLYDFINSKFFVRFMLVIIIISIIGIFLMTFEEIHPKYAFSLMILDSCIIGVFVVEAAFKITIYKSDYFKEPWNLLDVLIVCVHLLEVVVVLVTKTLALSTDISTEVWFKVLKSLRALRLLRIIKFLQNLQVVLLTVFQSMLSMGSIAVLMMLFIFVFAVMGRGLFAEKAAKNFGTLWYSFVTLFQILTLDDWFEILDPVKPRTDMSGGEDTTGTYWTMFAYLFCYIVIEYFVFLNLFVAVLVDNFQLTLADAEIRKKKEEMLLNLEEQQRADEMGDANANDEDEIHQLDEDKMGESFKSPELSVDDYFSAPKGSRESKVISEIFKDMTSLDFERWMWKRRLAMLNMVIDQALDAQLTAWSNLDTDTLTHTVPKEEGEEEGTGADPLKHGTLSATSSTTLTPKFSVPSQEQQQKPTQPTPISSPSQNQSTQFQS